MSELRQRFLVVRHERVGLQEERLPGVVGGLPDVNKAVARLHELERKNEEFVSARRGAAGGGGGSSGGGGDDQEAGEGEESEKAGRSSSRNQCQSRQDRQRGIQEALKSRKVYKEGQLVHQTEPDMKTHTSYLVFAVLPREWSEEDEAAAEAKNQTR
jgi:tRNA (adenine57-N1/adenine58-N1)-methyltransferase